MAYDTNQSKVTQEELACPTNTTKSYISKVENGVITPSVGLFYRLINAFGLRIEVVKPLYWLYSSHHRDEKGKCNVLGIVG